MTVTSTQPEHVSASERSGSAPLASCLAPWLRDRERSLLRQMVATVARPGVVSLAGGLPDPALFPTEELREAIEETLREDPRALQYSPAWSALSERIVELVRRRGIECTVDQVLITSGAQQGLDVAARALLAHRGTVAVEELTYPGALQAVAPLEARILPVRTGIEGGLDVDHLERSLRAGARPAFVYVIPDAHNPLGTSLARERREALAELARRYRLPIVEDDPYGLLAYDEPFAPPVRAFDADHVLYVGSFSKILAPGLRLGFLVVPAALKARFASVKEANDLETSGLTQRAVARLLAEDGWLDRHLARLRPVYRARRDALLRVLERRFGGRATWSQPAGGMFVWLELLQGRLGREIDAEALLRRCLDERGVAFLPGRAFVAASGSEAEARSRRSLRLSFSSLEPERIEAAVGAIADCLGLRSEQIENTQTKRTDSP